MINEDPYNNIHAELAKIDPATSILVLGAGFSRGAKNSLGLEIPSGEELRKDLLRRMEQDEKSPHSLAAVAQLYLQTTSDPEKIAGYLMGMFGNVEAAPHHAELLTLPWKRIFSINFDDLVENATRRSPRRFLPISPRSLKVVSDPKKPLCVHLNGYIRDCESVGVEEALRLTIDSYRDGKFLNSTHQSLFRSSVYNASAVIVIGSTLDGDLELAQMFNTTPRDIPRKTYFVLGPNKDPFVQASVASLGKLTNLGVEAFNSLIQSTYDPSRSKSAELESFATISVVTDESDGDNLSPTLEDLQELFLFGVRKNEYLAASISGDVKYYVGREHCDLIVDHIVNGEKACVIHSEFANGKSCLLDQVGLRLISKGFTVVKLDVLLEESATEISLTIESVEKLVILVDSYNQWIEILEDSGPAECSNVQFVLTSRSVLNEVLNSRLERYLGSPARSVCVDRLYEEDLKKFNSLMVSGSLWGEHTNKNEWEREHLLKSKCRSQIKEILSLILCAPQMQKRVDELFANLKEVPEVKSALVKSFIIVVLGRSNLGFSYLRDICGPVMDDDSFVQNQTVRQFFNFDNGTALMSSSFLAKYLLDQIYVSNPNMLMHCCVSIFERLSKFKDRSILSRLAVELMKTSSLQLIFKDGGPKECVSFYEKIRNFDFCEENHDYLLQFAIALTVDNKFPRAKLMIDASEKLAEKRGRNTDNIENHRARWILANRIYSDISEGAMVDFRKAHTILLKQAHRPEQREHPFKVASQYEKFYLSFADRMLDGEKREIVHSARKFLDRLEVIDEQGDLTRGMSKCLQRLERICPQDPAIEE
jgi:hypothetical protein